VFEYAKIFVQTLWIHLDDVGGIAPGTAFEDLPDDWVCPLCGAGKDMFEPVD
jgi:rubredoxin